MVRKKKPSSKMPLIIALLIIMAVAILLSIFFLLPYLTGGAIGFPLPYFPNNPPPDEGQNTTYSVDLNFNPNTICVGESVNIDVESNMPRADCDIYIYAAGIWTNIGTVTLDSNGDAERDQVVGIQGTFIMRLTCTDPAGSYKHSNEESLVVNDCDSDGDGFSNQQEIDAGTDPFDEDDYPTESAGCSETDGGMHLWLAGTCTDDAGGHGDYCDSELGQWLNEYYCDSGSCIIERVDCNAIDAICYHGECASYYEDSDGDGYSDADEAEAGTDQDNPYSYPANPETECAESASTSGYDHYYYLDGMSLDDCSSYKYSYCTGYGFSPGGAMLSDGCCLFDCNDPDDVCASAGYPGGGHLDLTYGQDCDPGHVYVAGTVQLCCMTNEEFCEQSCLLHGTTTADAGGSCVTYGDNWCVVNCGGEGYFSAGTQTYSGVSCCCFTCYNEQYNGWSC